MTSDAPAPRCPICQKPVVAAFQPFCSKRCADVDLQRWLTGRYAVPTDEDESDDASSGDAGQGRNGTL